MTDTRTHLNSIFNDLFNELDKYKTENEKLLRLNKELTEKYKTDMENKNNEISNFSKVSSIVSANKELNENKQYIKLLESQLEKFKKSKKDEEINKKVTNNEEIEVTKEAVKEPVIEVTKEPVIEKCVNDEVKISKVTIKDTFDVEQFEDINGYELLQYKKKYYLRDLETNEIYDIQDYKPKTVIGLMSNSRIKLHSS
jgi:hypothetical protein